MIRRLLTVALFALLATNVALAQSGTISGKITSADSGEELPGVNVLVVELERGTPTDVTGDYEITGIPIGTYNIRASYVGFITHEEEVTIEEGTNTLDIELSPDTQQLEGVVVTAFGLTRAEKSIGYSVQSIDEEAVTRVSQDNIVGALAGKISGVQVIGSSGANIGGSERIRIRGTNGLSDEQPLFVVDGTPIDNSSFTVGGTSLGRDLGNLASDLNLQSVESVSVLKGAAAAALYGNRASNGVIIITTKSGQMAENRPIQVDFSNSTYFESVYVLPEYQNEYAGGYHQGLIEYTDPETGATVEGLNYAADESWGPPMEGQMYRPWWSWFHHDFTGDGQDDYGTEIPLEPNSDNVRNFFDNGLRVSNNLAISGGSSNASYRVGLSNTDQSGVIPNSSLDKTSINFNGALSHSDRFTSSVAFNYVNTQAAGRPAQGYSATQGNAVQSFNQWFQRQLDMDMLREYQTEEGTPTTWNIRSPEDTRPLYWDSPFFSVNENVSSDDRDRIYGNYTMAYNLNTNTELVGKMHLDTYSFTVEDRIATGGLEEDWYYVAQRARREVNYELGAQYNNTFDVFTLDSYIGGNIRTENYNALIQQTVGGLSTPNFFNIDASINRPDVSSFNQEKQVNSLFGTATVGFQDLLYIDGSLRNDWSSALPADDNSNLYYGLSGSLVFTEFDVFENQGILSFGKLRASIAQVGNDLNPYQVFQTYSSGTPYGTQPAQSVPNVLNNPNLRPSVSSDYEFGVDLRFLDGRLRADVNYFNSVREDEILNLTIPGASGYSQSVVNAGNFTTTGLEVALGATAVQTTDLNIDLDINWSTNHSVVNELAEGIESRILENAAFGVALYAREGQEWGTVVTTGGYGGYLLDDEGRKIVNPNGTYALEFNKEIGNILPDWNGGLNLGINYRNFSLGTFFEFQKGGKFYSVTQMFGTYSGLHAGTVGDNTLGNPVRDPLVDADGNTTFIDEEGEEVAYSTLPLDNTSSNSGGALVEGVDEDGNEVAYLRQASLHYFEQFYNKERWLMDASYIKLREVKLTYNLPANLINTLPIQRASVALDIQNALLLYTSVEGVDPSIIQNNANGFGFWEGGGLPGTRSVGFNINISF
ncbi:MAG: SusC/RagA family TonB-linked outer membrane protein [Balneolaceae bacterium]